MSSERIIIEAIKVSQDLICRNLPAVQRLSDDLAIMRFRELLRSHAVRSALERCSDTLFAFALRAVERVIQINRRLIGT
jgi:hypothetical protein